MEWHVSYETAKCNNDFFFSETVKCFLNNELHMSKRGSESKVQDLLNQPRYLFTMDLICDLLSVYDVR